MYYGNVTMKPPIQLSYNNKNVSFKNRGQGGKTGPDWGLVTVRGEGCKERCRRLIWWKCHVLMYENGKMRPVKLFQKWGKEG
jgi:hypothetical protein